MRILTIATLSLALCGLGAAQSADLKTATKTTADSPATVAPQSKTVQKKAPNFLKQYGLIKVRQDYCSEEAIMARYYQCQTTCYFPYGSQVCTAICYNEAYQGCM